MLRLFGKKKKIKNNRQRREVESLSSHSYGLGTRSRGRDAISTSPWMLNRSILPLSASSFSYSHHPLYVSGIKPSVRRRAPMEPHRTYHSRVSRNFQSNVRNARGHLHRMPRQEIMRGREERERAKPPSFSLSASFLYRSRHRIPKTRGTPTAWLAAAMASVMGGGCALEESTLLPVTYQ